MGGTPKGKHRWDHWPLSFTCMGDFYIPGPVEDFIYVDDTSLCHASKDPRDDHLQRAANCSQYWADSNDMKINATKTKEMVFFFLQSSGGGTNYHQGEHG